LDIVVANYGSNDASVLLGNINIGFVNQSTLTSGNGSRPQSIVIADFNNDSRMDIAIANSASCSIAIFVGHGNISFGNPTTYSTGSTPIAIATGDFNDDMRLDIVVANYGSESLSIFLEYGDGSFANQKFYSTGANSQPYSVVICDVNNDAMLDIVASNPGIDGIGLFVGYGNGTFSNMMLIPTGDGSAPFYVAVGDFNKDRKLDFAVLNEGTDSLSILLQTC
ncbi:unnamed protein product, partial [Rotaria socialis]